METKKQPRPRSPEDDIADVAAERLRWLRVEKLRLTQPAMAAVAGVGTPSYCKYELGSVRGIIGIERSVWLRLAEAGQVSAAWLMGLPGYPMNPADGTIPLLDLATGETTEIAAEPGLRAVMAIKLDNSMDLRWRAGWTAWIRPESIDGLTDGSFVAATFPGFERGGAWVPERTVVRRLSINERGARTLWADSQDMTIRPILMLKKARLLGRVVRVSCDL